MTLREQIKEISNLWFNPIFADKVSMTTLVNALAVEAFKRLMESTDPEGFTWFVPCRAIHKALKLMNSGTWPEDVEAV